MLVHHGVMYGAVLGSMVHGAWCTLLHGGGIWIFDRTQGRKGWGGYTPYNSHLSYSSHISSNPNLSYNSHFSNNPNLSYSYPISNNSNLSYSSHIL